MVKVALWKPDRALALLLAIVFFFWSGLLTEACPFLCQCVNDQYIYCDGRGITPFMLQRMTKEIPANARFIDLSKNKLDNIPIKIFDHFPKIHHLNLAANQIRDLNPKVFYNLTTLNKLNLQANLLSQIKTNLLSGLKELEELHLECNYIQNINNDTFVGLQNLKKLYLHKNNIAKVQRNSFSGLMALKSFDASSNTIQDVSDNSFSDLRELDVLQLNNNQIESLTASTFAGLSSLKELFLDWNLISDLSAEYFSDMAQTLKVLSLKDNRIFLIESNCFAQMDQLQKLFLDGNLLSDFKIDVFRGLDNLKEIHLQHNKFNFLPHDLLAGADYVTYADFSHNYITSISTDAFSNFRESVRYLYLQKNHLLELHAGMFRRMSLLRELNVSHNQISLIRENVFETLRNLRILDLSFNNLRQVDVYQLRGAMSLEKLYLHGNPLQSFSGFTFSNQKSPIFVSLNLTVISVTISSVTVEWPYQKGTQLYWSMNGICFNSSACPFRAQASYFPTYKTQLTIDTLQPSSLYYICVNPNFMSSQVVITQCVHVTTPPSPYIPTMTTERQVSNRNTSSKPYHMPIIFMFLLLFIIDKILL